MTSRLKFFGYLSNRQTIKDARDPSLKSQSEVAKLRLAYNPLEVKLKRLLTLPLIFGLAYTVSACSTAKTADEVDAAVVPTGEYEQMSCEELRTENRKAQQELEDVTAAINKAYRDDKATEVVTWGLFLPAAFFMDGNSKEQKEYGEAKGRVLAIQDEMDSKCVSSDTNETT